MLLVGKEVPEFTLEINKAHVLKVETDSLGHVAHCRVVFQSGRGDSRCSNVAFTFGKKTADQVTHPGFLFADDNSDGPSFCECLAKFFQPKVMAVGGDGRRDVSLYRDGWRFRG